jgi:hypothetical protein
MTKDSVMNLSASKSSAHPILPAAAWAMRAWAPVLWQAREPARIRFSHLDTRVTPDAAGGSAAGQTLWSATAGQGQVGMAWDWVQIAQGVVAMADPMSVVSNVQLLGEQGEVLTPLQASLILNELVHDLPWQAEVQRTLSSLAS